MESHDGSQIPQQAERLLQPDPDQSNHQRARSSASFSGTETPKNGSRTPSPSPTQQRNIAQEQGQGAWSQHAGSLSLWKWELFYMCSSISAILAIAGVLFAYNDQPLNSWHAPLRPNTVVSALSTLSKSAMAMVLGQGIGQLKWVYFEQRAHRISDFEIFDSASRGPLGALQLLYGINWRAAMASVGAILMILALAVDPFVQQVISYDQRLVVDSLRNSTLLKARAYDSDSVAWPQSTSSQGTDLLGAVYLDMTGAMYGGAFNLGSNEGFPCQSGNCDWPSFETLGICSHCENVTEEVAATVKCTGSGFYEDAQRTLEVMRNCSYHFTGPTSDALWTMGVANWSMPLLRECALGPKLYSHNTTLWNSSFTVLEVPVTDFTFGRLTTIKFLDEEDDTGNCSMPLEQAYDCKLFWCARSYDGPKARDGTLKSPVPDSERLLVLNPKCENGSECGRSYRVWHEWSKGDNSGYVLGAWRPREMPLINDFIHEDDDSFSVVTRTRTNTVWGTTTVYSSTPSPKSSSAPFSSITANSTQSGSVKRDQAEPPLYERFKDDPKAFFINIGDFIGVSRIVEECLTTYLMQEGERQPGLATALYKAENFSDVMDSIARALTLAIREGPNSTTHPGETLALEQYIVVHWSWLTLPVSLVIFGVLFLAFSMLFAAETNRTVWKSSTIPALFHGLSGWTDHDLSTTSGREMGHLAKGMFAICEPEEDGVVKLVRKDM